MGNHPMGAGADPNPRFMSERIVDPAALNMGNTAENLHDRFPAITKDRTDAYAVASQDKLAAAYANGQIQPDLVPVATMKPGRGWTVNTVDEPPRPGTSLGDLATLKTPFRAHGRVTAGNAAGLNDGATAALLASSEDGSAALAWLPATSQLLLWSEAPPPRRGTRLLTIDPLQIAGTVVSVGFRSGRRPALLIQRDAGMWLAQLSPSTGSFEREEPLAPVTSPALLLPAGGILYGAGRELVLMAANGSERRLAVGGAVSSLAAMGDGWIHVALAGGEHYALRLTNSELALYRIPEAAP